MSSPPRMGLWSSVARGGQRGSGTTPLVATQNAAADAECPEGNEEDDGIRTHRGLGNAQLRAPRAVSG